MNCKICADKLWEIECEYHKAYHGQKYERRCAHCVVLRWRALLTASKFILASMLPFGGSKT